MSPIITCGRCGKRVNDIKKAERHFKDHDDNKQGTADNKIKKKGLDTAGDRRQVWSIKAKNIPNNRKGRKK